MRVRSLGVVVLVAAFTACTMTPASPEGSRNEAPSLDEAPAPSADVDASTTGPTRDASSHDAPDADVDAGVSVDAGVDADADAAPPAPDDGIRNGTETDVDCGGPDTLVPRCPLYSYCVETSDCGEGTCTTVAGVSRCQRVPSCTGAPGTRTCGRQGDEDCCTSIPVPEGTYELHGLYRNNDVHDVHVGPYRLDKFEITVGRLRAFYEAAGGNVRAHAPPAGAGAHPRIPNSGWRSSFNARLPSSWSEIHARHGKAGCFSGGDNEDGGAATWTAQPGPYEELPANCIDWYTLFAFCVWDGGRLPTDNEWTYAARGGDENRYFPWGSAYPYWPEAKDLLVGQLLDPDDGLYRFTVGWPFSQTNPAGFVIDGPSHLARPGSKTGDARWGHADMGGNVLEFTLDVSPVLEAPCAGDCARVDFPDPPQDQIGLYPRDWRYGPFDETAVWPDGRRPLRGGSFQLDHPLYTTFYYDFTLARTYGSAGGRCARD